MSHIFHPLKQLAVLVSLGLGYFLSCNAQPAPSPKSPAFAKPANTQKVDAFLGTLTPSTSFQKLESGNDLLLEFPAVAAAGPVEVKIVSTIPRSDRVWLLSLSPAPDGPSPLFASVSLEPSALPKVSLLLDLQRTQDLLLVVRANGKYYGLHRQIKIGQAETKRK
ncbi:hypothetical protein [Comamonas composti]|uniref:hypothetical protein n=1 Tax=Comamonas composti TaxID=408558 RepID=UPI00041C23AC|nr:hypothetical protein [Comamonas composti]